MASEVFMHGRVDTNRPRRDLIPEGVKKEKRFLCNALKFLYLQTHLKHMSFASAFARSVTAAADMGTAAGA